MNIRDLEYVVAVGRHLSFSKAAYACSVSQPALSNQIKKLETELNATLFDRLLQEVRPTELGKLVIASAERLLLEAQNIRDMATEYTDPAALPLRIGIVPSLAPKLAGYLCNQIAIAMPQMKLIIIEGSSEELSESIMRREVDVALIPKAFHDSPMDFTPLFNEPLLLAVPKNSEFEKYTKISFDEIPLESLILPQTPLGFAAEDEIRQFYPNIGNQIRTDVTSASPETMCRYIAEGNGCTIISELSASRFGNHDCDLTLIPISTKDFIREIGVISRIGCPRKPILNAIIKHIYTNPPENVEMIETMQDAAA